MNKQILIAVPVALLALGAISSNVFAQTESGRQSMITQLSVKLGLPETKVKQAFDEIHTERQKEMQKIYEDRLTQAVADAKLTADQKVKILAKHNELIAQKESSDWQNLTPADRRAKMNQYREDIEKWAVDNNVDISYLVGFGKGMMGDKGMGRGMHYN